MPNQIIKRWDTREIIFEGKYEALKEAVEEAVVNGVSFYSADLCFADLRSADLRSADFRSADLRAADLRSADLRSADLRSANLRSADLGFSNFRSADLRSADLRFANLRFAIGINKYLTTPLFMLLDQPGKIRAYKLVNNENEGPFNGGIKYEIGKAIEVANADTNENRECSTGISLATLDWCIKNYQPSFKILLIEHEAKDIAAIPIGSDGRYRVHRCTVVGEKDLKEIGVNTEETKTDAVKEISGCATDHNSEIAVLRRDLEEMRVENERLKATLNGDPGQTATKETRELWRASAVRYADKIEKELTEIKAENKRLKKEIGINTEKTEIVENENEIT